MGIGTESDRGNAFASRRDFRNGTPVGLRNINRATESEKNPMIATSPSHLRFYLIIEEYSFHPPIPMLPAPSHG